MAVCLQTGVCNILLNVKIILVTKTHFNWAIYIIVRFGVEQMDIIVQPPMMTFRRPFVFKSHSLSACAVFVFG